MDTANRHLARPRLGLAARLLGLTLPFAALVSTCALAQSAKLDFQPHATALTIVVPEFPAGATVPPAGVRVDVSGTVRANGSFEPISITSDGSQTPFTAAVAGVVKLWRFLPAVDEGRCAPMDAPSRLAIWFEGSAAEPRIFVSQPRAGPKVEPPRFDSIWDPKSSYTGSVEGQVRVLMLLSPEGRVKAAHVRTSSPPGYFDTAVLQVARRMLVTWTAPGPARDLCAQREYVVCLGSDAPPGARHPSCAHTR